MTLHVLPDSTPPAVGSPVRHGMACWKGLTFVIAVVADRIRLLDRAFPTKVHDVLRSLDPGRPVEQHPDPTLDRVLLGILEDSTIDCGMTNLWTPGTHFQIAAWTALIGIPRGTSWSYGRIACSMGRPKAARAVGSACAANPVMVLIPCHRAVRSDGSESGFRGGQLLRTLLAGQEVSTAHKYTRAM